MRIVLDTNVLLISIPKTSPYRPIFDAIIEGHYTLVITNEILSEYVEILSRHITPSIAANIARLLINLESVEYQEVYYKWQLIEKDPDDNKFVDCAIASNAKYIVTEDKHFTPLKKIAFPKIAVIDADDFLEVLGRT